MDPTRKKVILNEINFWKQNNMLPEHYCDYLIALYSEGENPEQLQIKDRKKVNGEALIGMLLLGIMSLSLLITYLTEFSFPLQTVILAIFVIILFLSALYYRTKEKRPLLVYIAGAFLLLLYTVQFGENIFPQSMGGLFVILYLHGIAWLLFGLWRKIPFFTFAGVIAILLISIFK